MYLPILCAGSVLRALVGVSGGATRAALTEHQARRNNMADVSAKDASQETALALLGLLLGFFLTPLIDTDIKTGIAFLFFTWLHLFANYMAVTSVIMEKLNVQRANIVIDCFVSSWDGKSGILLSPKEVAKQEKIWYSSPKNV